MPGLPPAARPPSPWRSHPRHLPGPGHGLRQSSATTHRPHRPRRQKTRHRRRRRQNRLLVDLAREHTGLEIEIGHNEATVIGNAMIQRQG